jgi:TatD DNase family protein
MSKNKRDIPNFELPIIETHCHLDYLKEVTIPELIEKAASVGIEKIMTIAVSPDNLVKVRNLVDQYDVIYGTQGIHPHDAEAYTDTCEAEIRQHITQPKILAVGEIGLDYFYDNADRKIQRDVFEKQLQIAIEYDKPVVIHTREADEDTQAILKNFAPQMKNKGVIHSFTSGLPLAEYCLSEGFCLGFNGICTFNKAENVREVVSATPIDQILLETDAPFLTPIPYRGKENAPYYLPFIAEKVAQVKDVSIEELLTQAYINSLRVFFNNEK